MKLAFLLLFLSQILFSTPFENSTQKENLLKEMITKVEIDKKIILGAMYSISALQNKKKSEVENFITIVKIQKILDTKENSDKIKKSFIETFKNQYTMEELLKRKSMQELEIFDRISKDTKEIELILDFSKFEIAKLVLQHSPQILKVIGQK
jgi:guanylate kinase